MELDGGTEELRSSRSRAVLVKTACFGFFCSLRLGSVDFDKETAAFCCCCRDIPNSLVALGETVERLYNQQTE